MCDKTTFAGAFFLPVASEGVVERRDDGLDQIVVIGDRLEDFMLE